MFHLYKEKKDTLLDIARQIFTKLNKISSVLPTLY